MQQNFIKVGFFHQNSEKVLVRYLRTLSKPKNMQQNIMKTLFSIKNLKNNFNTLHVFLNPRNA